VAEGSVDGVGEDLFDGGVVAVGLVGRHGGDGGRVGVGRERVIPPQRKRAGAVAVAEDAVVFAA
jgi:hypothetical protein